MKLSYKRKKHRYHPFFWIFMSIAVYVILLKLPVRPIMVSGTSMYPTYKNGQLVMAKKYQETDEISRNDVVVVENSGKWLIKRVVGLPGDTVSIENGYVCINGEQADTEAAYPAMTDAGILSDSVLTLRDGEYFCLGDNRNGSADSRIYGPFTTILYIVQ